MVYNIVWNSLAYYVPFNKVNKLYTKIFQEHTHTLHIPPIMSHRSRRRYQPKSVILAFSLYDYDTVAFVNFVDLLLSQ